MNKPHDYEQNFSRSRFPEKISIKFDIEVCLKYKAFMESSFKGFSFSLTFFAQAASHRATQEPWRCSRENQAEFLKGSFAGRSDAF